MTDTTPAQPLAGFEWATAVERIEDLWHGTKAYAKADKLFETFRDYPADIINSAITALFDEGRQGAPSPSKLKAEVTRIIKERGVELFDLPHEHAMGELPPSQLYGPETGRRGPGDQTCAVTDCGYTIPCHCSDCKADPLYSVEYQDAAG